VVSGGITGGPVRWIPAHLPVDEVPVTRPEHPLVNGSIGG